MIAEIIIGKLVGAFLFVMLSVVTVVGVLFWIIKSYNRYAKQLKIQAEKEEAERNAKRLKTRALLDRTRLRVIIRKTDKKVSSVESAMISELISFGAKITRTEEDLVNQVVSGKLSPEQLKKLTGTYVLVGFDLNSDGLNKSILNLDVRLIHVCEFGDEVVFACSGIFCRDNHPTYENLNYLVNRVVDSLVQHAVTLSVNS